MKKMMLILMLMTGCAGERYLSVVDDTLPLTTMIQITTVMELTTVKFSGTGMEISKSTATVPIMGAGVLVSPNGHVLTCAHLFMGDIATLNVVLSNGISIPATLLYKDDERDLAMLKIAGRHQYAQLTAEPLRIGQEVIAIGNPSGLSFSVSHGIVSALGRSLNEGFTFTQIDAPINPGNSGGPLFDLKGHLIGINARIIPGKDGLALSISPETIMTFLNMFKGV